MNNVFIERLRRRVKYEYIYFNLPTDALELYQGLKDWFIGYNTARRHKFLKREVPATVYYVQNVQTP
ncbi:MAG: transposase [Crocinitomicaceae bacterium]|nr:transposase [Crocinitomicaceae bacterium]